MGHPVLPLRELLQDASETITELAKTKTIINFFIIVFGLKLYFAPACKFRTTFSKLLLKNELYFNLLLKTARLTE